MRILNKVLAAFMVSLLLAPICSAHVHWTELNQADPLLAGLYHFDSGNIQAGQLLEVAEGMPTDRGLVIQEPEGDGISNSSDTNGSLFGPNALVFHSAQKAESEAVIHGLDAGLTIEFFLKWDPAMEHSSIEIGLTSGAKLRITRDLNDPSQDQFGIQATHGDFVSASGFPNWEALGEEEAALDEWRHVGVTIHSTGLHFDETLQHDVYNEGSVARFYWNGHLTGTAPATVDLSGVQVHDHSTLIINNIEGTIAIDEIAIWKTDWSNNGENHSPFSDGRGSGTFQSDVKHWAVFR